jgi:hypothetical protein
MYSSAADPRVIEVASIFLTKSKKSSFHFFTLKVISEAMVAFFISSEKSFE